MVILYGLVTIGIFYVSTVTALKCYDCSDTTSEKTCGTEVTCDAGELCSKYVYEESGSTWYIRGCWPTIKRNGCEDDYPYLKHIGRGCQCDTDLCNSANLPSATAALLVSSVVVMLCTKILF
jgi:hypothetical protein